MKTKHTKFCARALMFLLCATVTMQSLVCADAQQEEAPAQLLPDWQRILAKETIHTAQTLQASFPLVPDNDEEAVAEYKKRVLDILLTQPEYVKAWIRLVEILGEYPDILASSNIDTKQLMAVFEQLSSIIEQLSQEHLTDDQQRAIAQLYTSRGLGDMGDSRSLNVDVDSASLFNSGWKLVLALGACFFVYKIIQVVWKKGEKDAVKRDAVVAEVRKEMMGELESVQQQLQKDNQRLTKILDKATKALTDEEREALEQHRSLLKRFSDALHSLTKGEDQLASETVSKDARDDTRKPKKSNSLWNILSRKKEKTTDDGSSSSSASSGGETKDKQPNIF